MAGLFKGLAGLFKTAPQAAPRGLPAAAPATLSASTAERVAAQEIKVTVATSTRSQVSRGLAALAVGGGAVAAISWGSGLLETGCEKVLDPVSCAKLKSPVTGLPGFIGNVAELAVSGVLVAAVTYATWEITQAPMATLGAGALTGCVCMAGINHSA